MIVCENEIRDAIESELISAKENHGLFASPHEAYAVTLEEFEEVKNELYDCEEDLDFIWQRTKEDRIGYALIGFANLRRHAERLAQEACQLAAMAIKAEQSFAEQMEDKKND